MKIHIYKRMTFAFVLPQLFVIWLISADSHPVWIKHVTFGITMALIFLIFIIVNTVKFPDKAAKSALKSSSAKTKIPLDLLDTKFICYPNYDCQCRS